MAVFWRSAGCAGRARSLLIVGEIAALAVRPRGAP